MSTDRVKSEEFSKEGRTSAPIDLLDALLEEMLFLEGIGEVSARKIILIRETGIPLTMDILGRIPHFSVKRMQALMDRGLVRPLMSDCYEEDDDDEVEAKSVVISTTADRWYSILKSEREEMDRVRLDRDQMRMRYEMSEFTKQKEEEMNHILRKKEIEMERRLRTSFEGLTSAKTTTSSRSRPNLEHAGGEPTVSQDMSNKDDPAQEERRKIQELARNVPTDSIYRGRAFDKRSPLGTSTPRQYQHATSNPDAASSVEMRKSDTSTYNSSRDTRTSVSARSVTPVRVAEEQYEVSHHQMSHYLLTSHQKRSPIRLMRHRPAHGDHTNRDTNLLTIQHGNTRSVVAHAALLHQNFQHLQAPLELGNRSRSNLKKSPACTSGASGLGWND